jgi:hypothetical protein
VPRICILHFEDEPHRVPYPSLIEVEMSNVSGIEQTELVSSDDECHHVIKCLWKGKPCEIHYTIYEDIVEMDNDRLQVAILHLLDWSIHQNDDTGFAVYKKLREIGVAEERIWVVTGYANLAANQLKPGGNTDPRIFKKPVKHATLTKEVVRVVEAALLKSLAAPIG